VRNTLFRLAAEEKMWDKSAETFAASKKFGMAAPGKRGRRRKL